MNTHKKVAKLIQFCIKYVKIASTKNANVLKHGKQRGRVVSAKSRELISKFKINKAFVKSRKLKQVQALLNHTHPLGERSSIT